LWQHTGNGWCRIIDKNFGFFTFNLITKYIHVSSSNLLTVLIILIQNLFSRPSLIRQIL
jgi:hypothetical protein